MKKTISLLSAAALVAATLSIPALAVAQEGSNSTSVTATVAGISTQKPAPDGKIGEYEYQEIPFTIDDLRVTGKDDEKLAYDIELAKTLKLYAAYSADTMYVAVVLKTPEYVQTMEPSASWKQYSLQMGCARGDETTASNRTEFGIARRSDTNELMFSLGTDPYSSAWSADTTGKDFICNTVDDITTYELAIPAKVFGMTSFKKGDTVRMNFCINIALSGTNRGVIEWSQGTATGKDCTKHALVTLGDAIAAKSAATTTATSAPKTADPVLFAIVSVIAAVPAVIVSRKKH